MSNATTTSSVGAKDSNMKTIDQSTLLPGDVLLYFDKKSFVDWAIAVKTWNRIAHIEVYAGNGMSYASRNGIGVNLYAFRYKGLVCVRRATRPLDILAAADWFNSVRGQKYDWKGLLCFWLAVKQGAKNMMYCSEFALRWFRHGDFEPFNNKQDADKTPPSYFWVTKAFNTIWES